MVCSGAPEAPRECLELGHHRCGPGRRPLGADLLDRQCREPRLEVHVLGDCALGEGDHLKIEWLRFLRPEMKFASVDELRAQIARDRAAAEAFFAGRTC